MRRLLLVPLIALLLCFKSADTPKPLPLLGKIDNEARLEHRGMACRQ